MNAYEAGKLRGSTNDACERAKAEHENRPFVRDWLKLLDAEEQLEPWRLTPEGLAYQAQFDEIVRLGTIILVGEPTDAEIELFQTIKATPPYSEFERGEQEVNDAEVHAFVEWLVAKKKTPSEAAEG